MVSALRTHASSFAAATVAATLVVLYGLTLCPTVYWYDSAEFAAHAAGLGVPHPPGYPLYTLVAHVFTWLPGEPALGVNLLSLFAGVAAVMMLFRLILALGGSVCAACCGATTLGVIRTMWANAVVAEVYTPGLVMTLGALLLLVRAHNRRWSPGVAWAGLVGGLGVGVHMSIATFGVGYVWLVVSYERSASLRARVRRSVLSGIAAIAGLLVFLYIPLVKFETWSRREWILFRKNATGGTFKRRFLKEYDFAERLELVQDLLVDNLHAVGLALSVAGLASVIVKRPKFGVALVLAAGGNAVWFFNYDVHDLDVFYLPCMAVLCMGVGFSADLLANVLRRVQRPAGSAQPVAPLLQLVPWLVLTLPVSLAKRNYADVDLSARTDAAEYGAAACRATPNDAVLISYSSPSEWVKYSVYIYVQQGLQECTDTEVLRKPKLAAVYEALHSGKRVFAFEKLPRLNRFFVQRSVEPLWELHRR